jgi:putative membrane-bound dehydrogenase-like protein
MLRRLSFVLFILLCTSTNLLLAQDNYNAQWIRFQEENVSPGDVWYHHEVRSDGPSTGALRIVCDDPFIVWVNGQKVGEGEAKKLHRFSLNGIVGRGPNSIAIKVSNADNKSGLFVDGEIRNQGGRSFPADSGEKWVATRTKPEGDAWTKQDFKTTGWTKVKVLGPHKDSRWNSIVLKDTYKDRYVLAPGFEIERVAEPDLVGSLIAMTWGKRGRVIASRERGPILSVIDEDGNGIYDKVIEYSNEVKNCQGLCMVHGDVYAVGEGPKGIGMYRLPDNNNDDKADEVILVVNFVSKGMGDHAPHDVILGPDGWLYVNMGNHAWIGEKPHETTPVRDSYEGVALQPRFEDAGGHAHGIKVPGGTIWRFSPDGKQWTCETAGFRNEYDFAFNQDGDMFSYDSDMEWDVGMPWYRPTRINHCIPGAEFGWRSGCAKWPETYFDSLPGTVDVGRGSPTGVVFYNHHQFPEKYRNTIISCDWSLGRILAVSLDRDGVTYKGKYETLISGNPLNVADVEVTPDGSLMIVTGGRRTEGGIYVIRYKGAKTEKSSAKTVAELIALPQIQSAWAREFATQVKKTSGDKWNSELLSVVKSGKPEEKIRALTLLSQLGPKPSKDILIGLVKENNPQVAQFALLLLGSHTGVDVANCFATALMSSHPIVQRRACEAYVRSGMMPPAEALVKLLESPDRWLRFAARIAIERVDVNEWKEDVLNSKNPHVVLTGLLALNKVGQDVLSPSEAIQYEWNLLNGGKGKLSDEQKLELVRMIQLSLIGKGKHELLGDIGQKYLGLFPTGNRAYDFEIARVLAKLQVADATGKIMTLVENSDNQKEQIHYVITLFYLKSGWTYDLKTRLLVWYQKTEFWEGGNSFGRYLANIVGATLDRYRPDDRKNLLAHWKGNLFAARLVINNSTADQVQDYDQVVEGILAEVRKSENPAQYSSLVTAAINSLGKNPDAASQKILRSLFDSYPDQRDLLTRALSKATNPENWPYFIRGLATNDKTTLQLCLLALKKTKNNSPKPADIRSIILAMTKIDPKSGDNVIALLTRLTKKAPANPKKFKASIVHFQKVYAEKYPNEPEAVLPKSDSSKSKYTVAQVLKYLGSPEGKNGDVKQGREIFKKAKCIKCHRFLNEGDSVGPDLSTIRKRFQVKEIIESVLFPSQVISDQYRMVSIVTDEGLIHNGMPVASVNEPGKLTLLLSDATKISISKDDIDEQVSSKISVMPEGSFKELSLKEIADLFAFMETSKFNQTPAKAK